MPTILLRPFHHRGGEQLGLHFAYNADLQNRIKRLPGVRWSQTHRCWYLPCNERRMIH